MKLIRLSGAAARVHETARLTTRETVSLLPSVSVNRNRSRLPGIVSWVDRTKLLCQTGTQRFNLLVNCGIQ